jgi:predicted 2-oxoglutarate/Fe(II)-dependent dioxygenase YbiX
MNQVKDFATTADVPVLIEPAFLDRQACRSIRDAMDRGADEAAEVIGDRIARRETVRQARNIDVDEQTIELVETRIEGVRAAIECAMGQPLGEREGTGFLRYPPGGLYRPHRDRGTVAGWPAAARRQATVVLFLNGGAGPEPDFAGGDLHLYPDNGHPLRITPETGLLVAFPAHWLHEVRPVTRGVRDAAVDWFYDL